MIEHLPVTSRASRAADPDRAAIAEWDATNYLIADLFDLTAKAHFKNPEPYPRPAAVIAQKNRDDDRRRLLIERYEARQLAARQQVRSKRR